MRNLYDCLRTCVFTFFLFLFVSSGLRAQLVSATVFAGGGKLSGGLATNEPLVHPLGLAVGPAKAIYIADSGGIVHKVDSFRNMTTIAGGGLAGVVENGAATSATLSVPCGIVVDKRGNVYVTERLGNRVRKITPAGIISTVAGTGIPGYGGDGGPGDSAQLNAPSGLALDTAGNLYIADWGNQRVRKLAPDGTISTEAGTGVAGYNGDGIVATTAQLNSPYSLTTDPAGNLYIGELGNMRVRKISSSGYITTYAGDGMPGGSSADTGLAVAAPVDNPVALAFDTAGNLYISDQADADVYWVSPAGRIGTYASGSGGFGILYNIEFRVPTGIAVDSSGNFFVADEVYGTVQEQFTSGDEYSYTFAGNGAGTYGQSGLPTQAILTDPLSCYADKFGSIYFTDGNVLDEVSGAATGGGLKIIAGTGIAGSSGDGGPADSAQLNEPYGVFEDPEGNVYVGTRGDNKIRKITPSLIISTFAGNGTSGYSGDGGPATQASLAGINGLWGDAVGNIYVSDSIHAVIRKIDTNGIIHTIAGTGVSGYAGDGGLATNAQLGRPNGIGVDNLGNIYIGDDYVNTVRKIDTAGIITTIAGGSTARGYAGDYFPATSAIFGNITNIFTDDLGTVYICDPTNRSVRQCNVHNGIISPLTGTTTGIESAPLTSICLNGAGNFYVTDTASATVVELNMLYSQPQTDDTVTEYIRRPYFSPLMAPFFSYYYYYTDVIDNDTAALAWRHILSLDPSYGSSTFNYNPLPQGLYTFINHVDTGVQAFNGIPLDTRHYEIIPPAGGDSVQDAIEVWFTLTDAQNYDNYVNAHSLGLPLMVNQIHQTLNGNNIRILAFHGQGNTPATPNIGNIEEIDPNQVGEDLSDFEFNPSVPNYIITFQTLHGFSNFYITTGTVTPLPLTLLSFTGTPQGNDALLHWTTSNEVNTKTFFVQRSPDTSAFATVGSVAAQNTAGNNSYGYTDKGLVPGNYFYRLKMQDIAGNYTYSPIVEIPIGATGVGSFVLYPNPAKDLVYCQVQTTMTENCILQLTDSRGNILQTQAVSLSPGQTTLSFNISALASGSYFIVTVVNGQKTVQEFLK